MTDKMSFVSKILEQTGHLERRAVHEEMETLIQKQRELQFDVYQLAENKFSHFNPSLVDSQKLEHQVKDVRKQMTVLEDKMNDDIKAQLSLSTAEFQSLSQQLSDCKVTMEALGYLNEIYCLYESSVQSLEAKRYSEAVNTVHKVEVLLNDKQSFFADDVKVNILLTLKNEVFVQRCKVEQNMADMWTRCVKWHFPKDQSIELETENEKVSASVSLSIRRESVEHFTFQELAEGLYLSNLLTMRMKHFSEKFQKYIVPLILEQRHVDVTFEPTEDVLTLIIGISPGKESGKSKQTSHKQKTVNAVIDENKLYISVFDRLIKVLEYLSEMLLVNQYDTDEPNEVRLMSLLGIETSEKLLDAVQRDILAKAIPTTAKDLDGFDNVKTATLNLNDKLISLGYISSDYQGLKDSVDNVNLLFSNKKCALIMVEARELMKSDLLHSTSVDSGRQGDLPMLRHSSKEKKPQSLSEKCLSDDTFKMPSCQISQNVVTLMELAYATLQEATESSTDCAMQMSITTQSIFEMFSSVVLTHHSQNIEKLPQMAALHHNNCMYIAHHLMTLGHQFELALPSSSQREKFISLIEPLREIGNDAFLDQIKRQNTIVLECLDEADGFSNLENDDGRKTCERCMKQVLHQLHHLHNVFHPVLPLNMYHNAMGKLIQSVVQKITDCIVSMEDITQDSCKHLTDLLTPFERECAQIMEVEAAVLPCHIQNWSRLTNVKTVLNGRLLDIEQLWSDGKGPLSLTFSATELKQIIRALFQNTDRRADVLSKIK